MWRWSLDLPKGKPEGRRYFFSNYSARAYPLVLAVISLAIDSGSELIALETLRLIILMFR